MNFRVFDEREDVQLKLFLLQLHGRTQSIALCVLSQFDEAKEVRMREKEKTMAVVTITNDNFEEEVLACKIPVVIDFWADWCGPCKMQAPILEELAEELDGKVKFGKVNVDEEAALALKYQVMSIPTLVVMNYGIFQKKAVGLQDKEAILEMLKLEE